MSWCDENGFLGGRIDDWIRQHRKTHQQVFDLAHELNREGHAFLDGRSVTISDSHLLTSIVLFARLMELHQAVLLSVDRSARAPTRIMFRAFLEAFFHFAAIHKDPSYLDEYLDQFEHERKALINRIRHTDDPALNDLRAPIDDALIAEIETIGVRRIKVEDVARRADCHNIYVTAYVLLSRSVHSSAADLEAHLALDAEKQRIDGFRYGPTDAETRRTVCLAGMTMAEALRDISKDFSEDRTESCERLITSFKSLLPQPSESTSNNRFEPTP